MEIYEATFGAANVKLKERMLAVPLYAGLFFVVRFGWSFFWPTAIEHKRGLSSVALEIAFSSLLFGVIMAFCFSKRALNCKYKVLVDSDSITGVVEISSWMRRPAIRKTVRKGMVRTIVEMKPFAGRPGGVGISERGRFGARLRGFVFLPNTLPEFDELKHLAESWRVVESVDPPD